VTLSSRDLEDIYTELCYRMSERGDEAIPEILARLVLTLMHQIDEPERLRRAIDEALEDYPCVRRIERPA